MEISGKENAGSNVFHFPCVITNQLDIGLVGYRMDLVITNPEGKVLGIHEGIVNYTMGQRRGLGVSSNQGRLYVTNLDPAANTVTLGSNESLFSTTFTANRLNFIPFDTMNSTMRIKAKVRYRMIEQPCTVEQTGEDTIRVTFDQPQRAITPGQSVVLYDGEYVVGGGVICPPEP